ncbi:amino acid ABC transporter permease [Leifsonia bigeumensis]|uniref:Amino acid ABC transporter permease n=1 Tax=Leifsonella bigeumensis TaxID=433643 RepID=A0ABP7FHA2_9MICO
MAIDLSASTVDVAQMKVVPRRHPWRWVGVAIVLITVATLIQGFLTNPRYQWGVVGDYLLSGAVLAGLGRTLQLTAIAMTIAIILGIVLALMRLSQNPVLRVVAGAFVWLFRGTPLLVQLLFWNFISALFPTISIGVPLLGPEFVSFDANTVIPTFVAAILGLALYESAYMSEIVRAGILSVDRGQFEAAQSIGMRRSLLMRKIVLPQAMRVIIPPTGNETIGMLKFSSLVSVIGLPELLNSVQLIYARTFETIPMLIVATIWYLVVTTVLTIGQFFIERYFGRGARPQAQGTPIGQFLRKAFTFHDKSRKESAQ